MNDVETERGKAYVQQRYEEDAERFPPKVVEETDNEDNDSQRRSLPRRVHRSLCTVHIP